VVLCSNPSAGFEWSEGAQIGNPAIVEQVSHEYIAPGEQLMGAAGTEVWTFKALESGETTIYVEYSQPWDGGEKQEWTFSLAVEIEGEEDEEEDEDDDEDKLEGGGGAGLGIPCSAFQEENHISEDMEVRVNDVIEISLCSNPSTGFQWSEQAQIGDPAILEQTGHEYIEPGSAQPGAPGREVWTFRALQEGETNIYWEYSQPWDGGTKQEWTLELELEVELE
jgi:predicted secreted protein